jgi:ATP-dependent 26S proteasome regulatory subunit
VIPLPLGQVGDIELLIRARHGLIVLDAADPQRAAALFEYVADRMRLPHFVWKDGLGLTRTAPGMRPIAGTETLSGCLKHIAASTLDALYHLRGIDAHYDDGTVLVRLAELAERFMGTSSAILLSDNDPRLPAPLAPFATLVRLAPPTPEEYFDYLQGLVKDVSSRVPISITLTSEDMTRLLSMVQGLTYLELKKVMTQAMLDDGVLDRDVFESVRHAKRAVIERTGVLEYFPSDERLDEVAGLDALKAWLEQRAVAFREPSRAREFGLTAPRGILLIGVQGCGKSLCAKAVASAWQLPLLRFDPSRIFDRYVGQTEKNMAQAMRIAERMAPVILWIDELEKAFGQGDHDGGVSARLLGGFLAWMQDRREGVFVIATANDISQLPPELLRKGRFDEIFFVDLPDSEARRAIAAIHLQRRRRSASGFDLERLAAASDGFSGAELEQAIVSALYACFSRHEELTTEAILSEIARTRPLSVTMAEKVRELRDWARERAVAAHPGTIDDQRETGERETA